MTIVFCYYVNTAGVVHSASKEEAAVMGGVGDDRFRRIGGGGTVVISFSTR